MSGTEQWQQGDVVLAADLRLWRRASPPDPPWLQVGSICYVSEDVPVRPLTLLVRDCKPVTTRTCTVCGDGDLYPRRCSQCGQRWVDRACGPTHALIAHELGVEGLVDGARYDHLIDLCRRVVVAHDADDGGPMVAGSLLAELQRKLVRE